MSVINIYICRDLRLLILQEVHWPVIEKMKALQNIEKEHFLSTFMRKVINNRYVKMLVQVSLGNYSAVMSLFSFTLCSIFFICFLKLFYSWQPFYIFYNAPHETIRYSEPFFFIHLQGNITADEAKNLFDLAVRNPTPNLECKPKCPEV